MVDSRLKKIVVIDTVTYRRIKMKVLIADKLSAKAVSELEKLGAQVVVNPELTADDLAGALGDAEILIVRSTKVKAPAI